MLQSLMPIVRQAGQMMLDAKKPTIHQKEGRFNFVTETDFEIQEYLRGQLLALLPGSVLFSEEQENRRLTQEPTWVVDPIDGTINFMRDRGFSCVSVALLKDREPCLGMVYDPYRGEVFSAQLGQGALLNGQPTQVSQEPFHRGLLTMGTSPYAPRLADISMKAAHLMLKQGGDLRRSGSAALDLCWVACGRTELYYELALSPWDYAAGALMVREAGGTLVDPLGEPIDYGQEARILASNSLCADQAQQILRRAWHEAEG